MALEQNKAIENPHFKISIVSKIQQLKLLDGRRILSETKRSAIKLAKKEELRRKGLERKQDYLHERDRNIDHIRTLWKQVHDPNSEQSPKLIELKTRLGSAKSAYVELDGTDLKM